MNEYRINPWYEPEPDWSGESFSFLRNDDMLEFHRTLPGYNPTELKSLPVLAEELGLGAVYVKDESARFGIKSFKALGASYAIFSCLNTEYRLRFGESLSPADFISGSGKLDLLPARIFCAATDGNHGRAVAWTARMLKQQAIIYMPADSALQRIKNIENEGARVVLVEGTFDDCVGLCDRDARKKGWQVLSDTAYAGYMEIPKYIMLGYTSIFNELEGALLNAEDPGTDIVFLQTGVGGLSAAAAAFYAKRFGNLRPRLVCVEPVSSDCFLESIKQGMPSRSRGRQNSIMAGLNCGVPSLTAWPLIKDAVNLFLSVEDNYAIEAMRAFYREGVVSGESGAGGLAGLLALRRAGELKPAAEAVSLGTKTRVLLINTEGDTDPENYRKVIEGVKKEA